MANQVPERPVLRTQGQTPRATLRYSNGTVPSVTPYSIGATASHPQNQSQAKTSSSNTKPAKVPLFNPAELQFFKHFLKTEDGDAAANGYKPQLLSSYRFLSNSLSAVTSTLSSFVSPATAPFSQQYGTNSIQPDGHSGQTSALNSTHNSPVSHNTFSGNGYGQNESKQHTSAVSSASPVVQTNSFLRPQSAKHVNSYHNLSSESSENSVLHGPIVVESKPVSVSDQEREEERRRSTVKSPVNNSSLPRPPTPKAYGIHKNRTSMVLSPSKSIGTNYTCYSGTHSHGSYTFMDGKRSGSSPAITQQKGNQSENPGTMEQPPRRTLSASPNKFHKPLVVPMSYVHKSLGVWRSSPIPSGVTGTAIRSPRALLGPVEESRVTPSQSNSRRRPSLSLPTKPVATTASNQHNAKSNQTHIPSFNPVRQNSEHTQRTSPESSTPYRAERAQSLPSTRMVPPDANMPPDTNPLLGTFLGHTKVKNLNYTPAKPYHEITNSFSPAPSEGPDDVENKHLLQPNIPTVFYRKVYKPEEMLYSNPNSPQPKLTKVTTQNERCGNHEDVAEYMRSYSSATQGNEDDEQESFDADDDNEDEDDFDDDDDDDDDALDGIDEDDDDDSSGDDKSVISQKSQSNIVRIRSATKRLLGLSLSRSPSQTSVKSRPSSSRSCISTTTAEYQPALTPSLFCNIPPTVNFVIDGYKVEQLPWELRKLLKWRLSPITPNVVKNCIFRSHFRITKKNHDWIGYWGKHMKSHVFRTVQDYQKVNHFPGSFQIGRKDKLWRNLSRYQVQHGKHEFNFFPQTFVLPVDMKLLRRAWEEGGSKQKWILKPPASARGIGIKLINKLNQIPKKQSVIVQRYLSRPYLINDSKFDMRVYVYVSCYDPLRIYVYEDGLARFASVKYSHCMKNITNKYMHLTNYSINKKNQDYQSNSDENACQGHKWTLKTLWQYMRRRGVDTRKVWESMLDLIVKTIITSESCVNSLVKSNVHRRYSCHELFGFDIMLDETLKPWIIEVNISPSLHSNSSLDIAVKGGMIADLLNIAGFTIPDKKDVQLHSAPKTSDKEDSFPGVNIDPRLYPTQLAADEKAKHCYYCQRSRDEVAMATIFDVLTPDDLRILTESINEDSRKGDFVRVFPSPTSHRYHRFFEHPRYYNLLLDQWIAQFGNVESEGIYLLDGLCKKGIHLENPTSDPKHQWNQPHDRRVVSAPGPPKYGASSNLPSLRKARLMKANGSRSWHGSGTQLSTKKKKKKVKNKLAKHKEEEEAEEDSEGN